jgi:hypothetical protein
MKAFINSQIRKPSSDRKSFHKQPNFRDAQQVPMQFDVSKTIKNASLKILDAFVDLAFEFDDQPLLPSQVRATMHFLVPFPCTKTYASTAHMYETHKTCMLIVF